MAASQRAQCAGELPEGGQGPSDQEAGLTACREIAKVLRVSGADCPRSPGGRKSVRASPGPNNRFGGSVDPG